MSRKYRLATALDIDDLLMECTSYAIRLANEKYNFDPPMTIYEKETVGIGPDYSELKKSPCACLQLDQAPELPEGFS